MKYAIDRKLDESRAIVSLIALVSDIKINHYFKMASMALNKTNKEFIDKDAQKVNEKIIKTLERLDVQ